MDFPSPIHVSDIAKEFDLQLVGEKSLMATGINEIHKVRKGDITFVDYEKYYQKALSSQASIIIIDKQVESPEGKCLLVSTTPFEVYNTLVARYSSNEYLATSIHPTAVIHSSVKLEPNVVVGAHVVIGEGSYIRANTFIGDKTNIGKHTVIEPNVVIGSDAFYFKKENNRYRKWTTGGRVLIGDDVFIGAGTTVARGVSGDTVIGRGSRLDTQVQIGHGVVIGEDCLIAAQVGVAGKTVMGDRVVLYGQVGIAQGLHIGDDCVVLAKSGVGKDLETKKTYFGAPATEARDQFRQIAALKQLISKP